jgi:hypothetical protein
MRVLLHNTETSLYFAGTNDWTQDPKRALDFGSVEHAVAAYKVERVSFAEIVVDSAPNHSVLALPDETADRIRTG